MQGKKQTKQGHCSHFILCWKEILLAWLVVTSCVSADVQKLPAKEGMLAEFLVMREAYHESQTHRMIWSGSDLQKQFSPPPTKILGATSKAEQTGILF